MQYILIIFLPRLVLDLPHFATHPLLLLRFLSLFKNKLAYKTNQNIKKLKTQETYTHKQTP